MAQGLVTESWGLVQVRQFAEDEQALQLALNEAAVGHLEMVSDATWRMYINGHGWRLRLPVNLIATLLKARLGDLSVKDAVMGTAVVFGVTPAGREADAPPDVVAWAQGLAAGAQG